MGPFATGEVVLVQFPFSDLSASKLRPAVVLAAAGRGDWILCQITSKPYGDAHAISLGPSDFASGSLRQASCIRPGKLFTAHSSLVASRVGVLHQVKANLVRDAVVRMIRNGC
jgi:mRNA interferase MazF